MSEVPPEEVDPEVEEIEKRFSYHPATTDTVKDTHEKIRRQVKDLAYDWNTNLPFGREQALAVTKLEEAMFWANAAIARNQ